MKNELDQIVRVVKQVGGNDISIFDDTFLVRTIEKRLPVTNCASFNQYLDLLEADYHEVELLNRSLIIPFSEFYRNPLTFSLLEQVILPKIIQRKSLTRQREIRVWSAACAGGQEAYSLAMILEELLPRSEKKMNYRIFATDLQETQLEEARRGSYTENVLGQVSLKRLNRWFEIKGNSFTIHPDLRANIDFSVFDLLDQQLHSPPSSIFGGFDLIFCANLLFYYKAEYRRTIIRKIGSSLANEGYIVTGETEREILLNLNYHEIFMQSAIFHI
jgi:chemotaxis protein methyltransferase CheR